MMISHILLWFLIAVFAHSLKLQHPQNVNPMASVSLHTDTMQADGDSDDIPGFLKEIVGDIIEAERLKKERKEAMFKMLIKKLVGSDDSEAEGDDESGKEEDLLQKKDDDSEADGDDDSGKKEDKFQTLIKKVIGGHHSKEQKDDSEADKLDETDIVQAFVKALHKKQTDDCSHLKELVPDTLDLGGWIKFGQAKKFCKAVTKQSAEELKEESREESKQELSEKPREESGQELPEKPREESRQELSEKPVEDVASEVPKEVPPISMSMQNETMQNETNALINAGDKLDDVPVIKVPSLPTLQNDTPQVVRFTHLTDGQNSTSAQHEYNTTDVKNGTDMKNSSNQSSE